MIPDTGRSIGRIPDEGMNPTFDYISTVLKNQALWMNNKSLNNGWFALVNQAWSGIGNYMKLEFNMDDYKIAPPTNPSNISVNDTTKKLSYINLHGGENVFGYYSQSNMGQFAVALNPTDGNFNGCLPFFEACFGGYCINRSKEQSIPLNALYYNAVSTVSSTSTAYGPSTAPPMAIDLLAECFYKRILSGNTTIGEAFTNAKVDFGTITMKQFGSMSGSAKKSLIQTVLYGCPDIKI